MLFIGVYPQLNVLFNILRNANFLKKKRKEKIEIEIEN